MFDFFEDTGVIWFRSHSFEESQMFLLIGVICGLAIYNSTIIDLPFPLCLYKKLLQRDVNLDDLRGLQPDVARSLQQVLDYTEDDIVDVFGLTFQVTEQSFGASINYELIANGANTAVTHDNKEEYVQAYIDYKLNHSVAKEFDAFARGFHRVCGGQVLNLFHPQELMELVVGSQHYDFSELEVAATYQGEYYHNHPVILRFWEVFRSYPIEMKKKFLQFLTGSDKVSIFGMKNMKFIIQPVAVSEAHLPVAHTCFNLLDLPRYSSTEVMREKLTQAIQNGQGFGLV
jgi:E3 ubiquitin-protein ligase HERC4